MMKDDERLHAMDVDIHERNHVVALAIPKQSGDSTLCETEGDRRGTLRY